LIEIAMTAACRKLDIHDVIGGYAHFLETIMDPHHEEYEEMLEWAGGDFDPERFNPEEVFFDDPDDRLDMVFL
jgi:hypothetical protein